jgi:hypothetical protein
MSDWNDPPRCRFVRVHRDVIGTGWNDPQQRHLLEIEQLPHSHTLTGR